MNDMGRTGLAAFPMHGQYKLSNEGYRTRDGHLIEWFAKILERENAGSVSVFSRPEPRLLAPFRTYPAASVARNTHPVDSLSWALPPLRDRQRWWVSSLNAYQRHAAPTPVVTWNPFLALSNVWPDVVSSGLPVAFDLLDDWTIHYAFAGVRSKVEEAYRELFSHAHVVTANAEGTVELAKRFGRHDVVFLPNGCDPERFDRSPLAVGPITIGYVGKIGKRLDLELIVGTARDLPHVRFVFAGPILDSEYRTPLENVPNIELVGDVHYQDVPRLLQTFDVGWVPHRVGEGEVGGDVIKTYEYRAAGLPTLTTPVQGADRRGLSGVTILPRAEHADAIRRWTNENDRVPRNLSTLPESVRWESKAEEILARLNRK
ncbi:glycosyltransferase [Microbacterium kunmingense]|uniref:glycosyltransferase n=1 Tax=Microbacterium kunmingense TaxID=2915939 RepID=UPI0020058233|nr:glycosyltransferase [Microbacterium kunmingense]